MEDIRTYRDLDEPVDRRPAADDDRRNERVEWSAPREEEVPFHIPRD